MLEAVPPDCREAALEDLGLQGGGAVGAQLVERAALVRVDLVHEHERLGLAHRGVHLAQAVAREEVALREEECDASRAGDVVLELRDVPEVVDVAEDADARQQREELLLDQRAAVLPRQPDVREERMELAGA